MKIAAKFGLLQLWMIPAPPNQLKQRRVEEPWTTKKDFAHRIHRLRADD